ncbi:DUF2818 family protein [Parachitinimonas caeni]|uniref:DUF2818 family protein n=1 Tax=Parachitinimonas caeni TaxID=3031301 RepID=A0ABT7DXM5_9NEIS|nr:DUF2818 family protein [Parachitinimonas caeni]MDK2124813.1 DUF2818 family protein [Parachitinimonas caeni]
MLAAGNVQSLLVLMWLLLAIGSTLAFERCLIVTNSGARWVFAFFAVLVGYCLAIAMGVFLEVNYGPLHGKAAIPFFMTTFCVYLLLSFPAFVWFFLIKKRKMD